MTTPMIDNPSGGRSIPEWIGDHPDQKIPEKVRDRVLRRYEGRCYLTGRVLRKGEYDIDHIKRLDDGGEHREKNLAPIWRPKHREKTGEENSAGAKADRIRRKHNGTWPKPAGNARMQSRGFESTRGSLWQRKQLTSPMIGEHDEID